MTGGIALGVLLSGFAVSAGTLLLVFGATWLVALRAGRVAVVDAAWGLGFVAVAAAAAGWAAGHAAGTPLRQGLVLGATTLWGGRLAVHLGLRVRGGGEDPRYAQLLARRGGARTGVARYALGKVFLPQAGTAWVVSLPLQVAMVERAAPGPLAWAGLAVWLIGMGFEAVGDAQLARFRAAPANRRAVLDRGLWRYTRHPNYFGDACVWWGLYLLAAREPAGAATVVSPALMTWLLARGTGKPLLESRLGTTRPGYADYVRRTSGFVPLPPRGKPAGEPDPR